MPLQQRLRPLAAGLTPRQALEQLAGVQMPDVEIPTTDGRLLQLTRYPQPDKAVQLLLQRLEDKNRNRLRFNTPIPSRMIAVAAGTICIQVSMILCSFVAWLFKFFAIKL